LNKPKIKVETKEINNCPSIIHNNIGKYKKYEEYSEEIKKNS